VREAAEEPNGTVTLWDVARAAEVSIATASRAINGRPYVSEDTRARVLAAVERLHFQPSTLARSFRAQRSLTIGMIVPDISSPFYAAALRGAQHTLNRHGYTVLVCDTEEQAPREAEALALLAGQRVAGLILAPAVGDGGVLRRLRAARSMALVAIDNRLEGSVADTVLMDNVEGAAVLTAHLIGHGHRRIGHVAGILHETSGVDRLSGYRQALVAAGLPYEPDLVVEGDWTEPSGYAAAGRLLDLPDPPTALFVAGSPPAVGALLALRDRGIAVPGEVALACFDDTPWAPLVEPPLTALERQDYALGQVAADLILEQLSAQPPASPRERLLPMRLVVRRSCGCSPVVGGVVHA
jgi:DNA-binding LacI/PurR family transcriptional regulator